MCGFVNYERGSVQSSVKLTGRNVEFDFKIDHMVILLMKEKKVLFNKRNVEASKCV